MFDTERLTIRRIVNGDFDDFYKIRMAEGFLKYNPMPKVDRNEAYKEFESFLKEDSGALAIVLKEEQRMIGQIDYYRDGLRYGVSYRTISYNMNADYSGFGYITEALKGLLEYFFTKMDLDIVQARVFADNAASVRIMEKLNFVQEGCLRQAVKGPDSVVHDDLLFSILKSDYLNG